jgi:hypothetical protein
MKNSLEIYSQYLGTQNLEGKSFRDAKFRDAAS